MAEVTRLTDSGRLLEYCPFKREVSKSVPGSSLVFFRENETNLRLRLLEVSMAFSFVNNQTIGIRVVTVCTARAKFICYIRLKGPLNLVYAHVDS